jgi:hypothetical protein
MDEQDDQIAHHGILAGREVLPNYGRNNNSQATGNLQNQFPTALGFRKHG